MKNKKFKKVGKRQSEKGLSAVELIIAMAIFLVVMSSVYGILKIGNISRSTVNSRSENIKNVRMAINSIGREAINAGLGYNRIGGTVPDDFTSDNFQLPRDPDDVEDLLTAISAGNNITESDFSKNGEKNDVMAFAFRDFQFNNGFPIEIKDVTDNGDTLVLKTPDGACASCRPYDLFLIETSDGKQAVILSTNVVNQNSIVLGGGNTDPLKINYGKGDAPASGNSSNSSNHGIIGTTIANTVNGVNGLLNRTLKSPAKRCANGNKKNCIDYGTTTVIAKKIYLISYSVAADGTLIRTTYGNNTGAGVEDQILRQPIASGVRSLKIQYLLSDGTVTEDPSEANTQKERCNEIVQLEVSLTVDAETSSSGETLAEPITLTSTFSTRNLKYDVY